MDNQKLYKQINENKYLLGLMMILVTVGGRFIISELNEEQKKNINNKTLRRLFIFGVFFMATRDIVTSLILTIVFVLTISELFNDEEQDKKEEEINVDTVIENIQNELDYVKSKV
tara:strand:- start:1922 stop:2266 length:345 start_codon:yes stop_codon:yes gene_type:complete